MNSSRNSSSKGVESSILRYASIAAFILVSIVVIFIIYRFLFKAELFDSKPTITYYYLKNCGWCKKFSPVWDQFEKEVKAKNINIIPRKIDASKASSEVAQYNIKGYPHVQLVKGTTVVPFNGERTVQGLLAFVKVNS
jgi:thiol-disulfide isomerase/thioredoxin